MFSHDVNELIVREVPACHMFPISSFLGAQSILGFQPSLPQELLQRFRRKRFFDVVDRAEVHALLSQGPLDLPARASSRLFVYHDLGLAFRHRLFFLLP